MTLQREKGNTQKYKNFKKKEGFFLPNFSYIKIVRLYLLNTRGSQVCDETTDKLTFRVNSLDWSLVVKPSRRQHLTTAYKLCVKQRGHSSMSVQEKGRNFVFLIFNLFFGFVGDPVQCAMASNTCVFHDTCLVSRVTCQVSGVRCHMSPITLKP